jgi:hypothetical protein
MRIAVLQNRNEGAVVGEQLLEGQITIANEGRASRRSASCRATRTRSLRPEQHFHIAAAYDKAAFDISLPAHTRAVFAKKADWFRLLARVGEKKEQVALAKQQAKEPQPNPFGFIAARH